ncbi:MAG: hypothetical protein KAI57_03170 [Candidatus Pacebacteria bacterium]|nr:hypothetical protein [Candidatus Paceibacterota bacterium]
MGIEDGYIPDESTGGDGSQLIEDHYKEPPEEVPSNEATKHINKFSMVEANNNEEGSKNCAKEYPDRFSLIKANMKTKKEEVQGEEFSKRIQMIQNIKRKIQDDEHGEEPNEEDIEANTINEDVEEF